MDLDEYNEVDEFDIGEIVQEIDLDVGQVSSGNAIDVSENDDDDGNENEEHPVDMSHLAFSRHKGSVFACCISPCDKLIATGGEDDMAYIWGSSTAEIIFPCTGHKDSVTCLQFSFDGELLASGDMGGLIQAWKISSQQKIWEFETGDLNWLVWHNSAHVLLAGTAEGTVWLFLVPQGNTRTFPSYGAGTQCGLITKDGKRAAVGYENGSIRIFDLKSGIAIHEVTGGLAHSQTVTALDCHANNTLIISSSMDGTAKLINTQNGKVMQTFCSSTDTVISSNEEMDIEDSTVECISFCPHIPNIAVVATLSGQILILDIVSQAVRDSISQGCGSSKIVWHPVAPIFITASLDGILREYDVRTGELQKVYTGHTNSILCAAVSKDGSFVVTASDDETSRVFCLK